MKKLFYIFLNKPVTTIMLFLCMLVVGFVSLYNLPIELSPEIEYPKMTINVSWSGVSPETVEALLTSQIEAQVSTISGIKKITSRSELGGCSIDLEFHPSLDMNFMRIEINEKLSSIRNDLPLGVSTPRLSNYIPSEMRNLQGFLTYSISADVSSNEIRKYVKENVLYPLQAIDGISEVEINGGSDRELDITVIPEMVATYKITNDEIDNAVRNSHMDFNSGVIRKSGGNIFIKIKNEIDDIEIIKEQVVKYQSNGKAIKIGDIALIKDGYKEQRSFYRINGKETITLTINKEVGANSIKVARNVFTKIEELENKFPAGYKIKKEYDSSESMKNELEELSQSAIYSIIILTGVLLLIFRRIRYTIIIICSILFSLLTSFLFFYIFNIPLNVLTISAFIIGFGFMVDNSIVVIDFLDKHYQNNLSNLRLAVILKNIFAPVFASTITTIAVFIPLVFLTGELKLYFSQFSFAVLFTLISSLFISFTFIPVLYKKIKTRNYSFDKQSKNRNYGFIFYNYIMQKVFKFKKISLTVLILIIGLPVWLIPTRIETPYISDIYNPIFDTETYEEIKPYINYAFGGALNLFFNQVSRGEVWKFGNETYLMVSLNLPNGNIIDRLNNLTKEIEKEVLAYKSNIKEITARVYSEENASIQITFTKSQANSSFPFMLKNYLTAYAVRLGGLSVSVYGFGPGFFSGGGSGSFTANISVKGFNYKRVKKIAEEFRDIIKQNPRVDNIDIDKSGYYFNRGDVFEMIAQIDRDVLLKNNISIQNIISAVNKNTQGEFSYNRLNVAKSNVGYSIKNKNYDNIQLATLEETIILNDKNEEVKLKDLIDFSEKKVMSAILRENQQYVRYIGFEYKGPYKYGQEFIENSIKKLHLPEGYVISQDSWFRFGEKEETEVMKIMLIAIGLIFMITASLFESLKSPFLIIIAIPFALLGTIYLFYFGEYSIDRGAYAGMLLLIGLSVNNSIILVDYLSINKINIDINCIIKNSYSRIRAIFTTTITTLTALIPILLSPNTSFWKSLSLSISGGIVLSAIIIVIYIPMFFYKINKN